MLALVGEDHELARKQEHSGHQQVGCQYDQQEGGHEEADTRVSARASALVHQVERVLLVQSR